MIIALLVLIAAVLLFGAKSVRDFISSAITVAFALLILLFGIGLIMDNSWGWGIVCTVLGGGMLLLMLLMLIGNTVMKIMKVFSSK
ncbi:MULTISPECIES: hypothetical protein [Brevibacillus]|uniref:hypothetical protein n=1 Tax=Brevibacillus TaxID=55080 RepID=UPI0007AB2DC5|nr:MULTISPECIES: hypothetical protein [Brevibacillus]KZE54090.1 hypothetical protein AV540_07665 [Brevibacillus parabrevis]MDH6350426.1 putative membrane protein [Brevibacillus sp. 1238]MDR4998521.1 hypothetical protein [Brevibacillus parabrevis]MED2258417.1 hypothetical protein [Brevibacillus parabrevis]WDV94374.1 hypothetical protein PSE45_22465 [Brevibacillus parabrevis]